MKYLLVAVAFVALFYHSESVITCYDCRLTSVLCTTQKNCSLGEDSCIWVSMGEQKMYGCWKYSQCDAEQIEHYFHIDNFKYHCCNRNLCNSSPITVAGSKITLSIAFILTTGIFLLS